MYELYNAGHLIEAALAHNQAYENDVLLGPVLRHVELLCSTFGPRQQQIHGYPGHPEIELALLRLFDRRKDLQHLDLARYFITERGKSDGVDGRDYYDVESEKRGDDLRKLPAFYPHPRSLWYHQAHQPIKEQMSIEGHSVRAMYLLTATADLVRIDKAATTEDLKQAVFRLWDSMTQRKIGPLNLPFNRRVNQPY
ncbi:hypothetical protein WHR41_09425 [Cladosporium halotolerans]|uniref:Non-reducing end beta-L-arabinofuranosidase-like GH127 catalytic domain-containing protein n=1 Tax=Cladosporium halotolerans TaxID=1052096 RepID=A0AB34KCE5_9PEZI